MNIRVLIIHRSPIVAEGLEKILHNSTLQLHDHLKTYNHPDELSLHSDSNYVFLCSYDYLEILKKNQLKGFQEQKYRYFTISNEFSSTKSEVEQTTIYLDCSSNQIIDRIRQTINSFNQEKTNTILALTDRETEVLKLVALGNANKEIANKLSISAHTVITHRKNITEKLGIKSISGLTVYAILNKIIDTDELSIGDLI